MREATVTEELPQLSRAPQRPISTDTVSLRLVVTDEERKLRQHLFSASTTGQKLFGKYTVELEHARGGLGRILKARDPELDRVVALKHLISTAGDSFERFIREALVTAKLQHPGIVPLYEMGYTQSGDPYYSMRFVTGQSFAEAIAERKRLEERLTLLPNIIAVAEAMAYAHSEGVIHRDLKPSNILIGPFGETVVIDWGIARDLKRARDPDSDSGTVYQRAAKEVTLTGSVLGTPEYMAPEQAEGQEVDERVDVYALGALLYHLFSGRPPYRGKTSIEIIKRVTTTAPIPLAKAVPKLSSELIAIVNKAMARKRSERYRTAKELRDDLKRFHAGQLVTAYNYSRTALLSRWLKRHKLPVAIAAASTIILAITGALAFRRVVAARNIAERRQQEAEISQNKLILMQAKNSLALDPTTGVAWLKKYPVHPTNWIVPRELAVDAVSYGVASHVFPAIKKSPIALSPDGQWFAYMESGRIVIRDTSSWQLKREVEHKTTVSVISFSPDGTSMLFVGPSEKIINVWNTQTMNVSHFVGHQAYITDAQFSPDGTGFVSSSVDGSLRLWNITSKKSRILRGHTGRIGRVSYSPMGDLIASAGQDKTLRLWETKTGLSKVIEVGSRSFQGARFSPDGRFVAYVDIGEALRLWEVQTQKSYVFDGNKDAINDVAFTPDSERVATAGTDKTIRIWNIASGKEFVLNGHGRAVRQLTFSPSGKYLASTGRDSEIYLWDVRSAQLVHVFHGHEGPVGKALFSLDEKDLISSSSDGTVRVWPLSSLPEYVFSHTRDDVYDVSFSPNGKNLASAGADKTVRQWDLADGRSQAFVGHEDTVVKIQYSSDGNFLASSGLDQTVRVWGTAAGETKAVIRHSAAIRSIAFTPDSEKLLSTGYDKLLRIWNVRENNSVEIPSGHGEVTAAATSPDGKWIASAGEDRKVRLWNTETLESTILINTPYPAARLFFSPNSQLLAWTANYGCIELFDLVTRTSYGLPKHNGAVYNLAFSSNGALLASASEDKTVRVWDIKSRSSMSFDGFKDSARSVVFTPDNKFLAAGSNDGSIRVWNLETRLIDAIYRQDGFVTGIALSPDGQRLASSGVDGKVRVWRLHRGIAPPSELAEFNGYLSALTNAGVTENSASSLPKGEEP